MASAPEIELFPDEEDAFYKEASTYVGDVNDSGDELENSYAGSVTRYPEEDRVEDRAEDGESQADLERNQRRRRGTTRSQERRCHPLQATLAPRPQNRNQKR